MPILSSAKKALRRDKRRTEVNRLIRARVRRMVKQIQETKDSKDLPSLYSSLDRASKRNILHKNKAARLKSRLTKLVYPTE